MSDDPSDSVERRTMTCVIYLPVAYRPHEQPHTPEHITRVRELAIEALQPRLAVWEYCCALSAKLAEIGTKPITLGISIGPYSLGNIMDAIGDFASVSRSAIIADVEYEAEALVEVEEMA